MKVRLWRYEMTVTLRKRRPALIPQRQLVRMYNGELAWMDHTFDPDTGLNTYRLVRDE